MKMSRLFSTTLREAPADAEVESHKLLVRAGFIRQLGAGVYSVLPLAKRTLVKIENIMRREIDAIGGQVYNHGKMGIARTTYNSHRDKVCNDQGCK